MSAEVWIGKLCLICKSPSPRLKNSVKSSPNTTPSPPASKPTRNSSPPSNKPPKPDPNNLLQGWEYKSVFDIAEVRYGFPFNSELFCSDSSLNPIVRIRDILEESTDTYSSETADEKYLIQKNDILIGMDGIFHMTIWSNASMWQNQRIVRVRCLNKSLMSAYQIMFSIYAPIKSLESSIEGTTVAHLSDKDMKKLKILVAPEIVQNDITQKLNSILEVVENKKSETRMLAQMQTLFLSKMGA